MASAGQRLYNVGACGAHVYVACYSRRVSRCPDYLRRCAKSPPRPKTVYAAETGQQN